MADSFFTFSANGIKFNSPLAIKGTLYEVPSSPATSTILFSLAKISQLVTIYIMIIDNALHLQKTMPHLFQSHHIPYEDLCQ